MPSYDFIAFGAGFAGLIAANRAAELGLKAIVLERETDLRHVNNSRVTNGVANIAYNPIDLPEDELVAVIDRASAGHADKILARAFAAVSGPAIEWLRAEGIAMDRLKGEDAIATGALRLAPHRRAVNGIDWDGNCGDITLQTLEKNLIARGGTVERGTKVVELLEEDGRCVGVLGEQNGKKIQFKAAAVLAADGGYMGNRQMIGEHITTSADKVLLRSCLNVQGDGIRMAQAIGAVLTGLGQFYGHLQHRDAMTNEKLWPYPTMDALAQAGIVVTPDGRRFTDEGAGGVPIANAVAQLADPLSATLIFDAEIWATAGKIGPVEADPYLETGGGWKHEAKDLATLAELAGLNPEGLIETVTQNNNAITSAEFGQLSPVRTTEKYAAMPIVKAPFFAIPLCAGITGTMGGLRIDGDARVLRADGSPIDGLYAAGTNTGGLEGGPKVTYAGGLSKAFIWSFAAAEHAASNIRPS